jgi:hypothetical protein
MGVSPASLANVNQQLTRKPLPVVGDLPNKKSTYCNNKYRANYDNNYGNNSNGNTKDTTFNPSRKLTIFHQNVRGLGKKNG